jgi:hypothetical protein
MPTGFRGRFLTHKATMLLIFPLCCSALITGCGAGTAASPGGETQTITGRVHGGQQPVSSAAIQLYTVGSTGLASAATPMLTRAVSSESDGSFDISDAYTCGESSTGDTIGSGSDQVYIVATGGNPGLNPAVDNKALVLMAALGSCSSLPSASYVEINEVTTAAAAWALAPFITSATQAGASSTDPDGITNAFLDAALLADTTSGLAATIPSNLTIETGKLYALADALSSCVNSDGTTGCTKLFSAATPSGGTAPTDTLGAALNIVKHPGQNVAAVFGAIPSTPPFVTSPMNQPNDWTMSLTVTGGGLFIPTALGVDAQNNVWVANQDSPLSEFNAQGSPITDTGYGSMQIAQVFGLAIDSSGDVWVTNYNGGGHGSITEFSGSTSSTPGTILGAYTTDVFYPYAISADTGGKVFVAQDGSSAAAVYNSSGMLVNGSLGSGVNPDDHPQGIAVDANDGFWLPSSGVSLTHYDSTGTVISQSNCCEETYGVATDASGNAWVADYLGGTSLTGAIAEIAGDAVPANAGDTLLYKSEGGINHPAFVAIDGAQNVWVTNYRGASFSEFAGNGANVATVPAGTALSPTVGVNGTGGFGLDANLNSPFGVVPDRAGNLWISNEGNNNLVMFFGLAAPTVTPLKPTPQLP